MSNRFAMMALATIITIRCFAEDFCKGNVQEDPFKHLNVLSNMSEQKSFQKPKH